MVFPTQRILPSIYELLHQPPPVSNALRPLSLEFPLSGSFLDFLKPLFQAISPSDSRQFITAFCEAVDDLEMQIDDLSHVVKYALCQFVTPSSLSRLYQFFHPLMENRFTSAEQRAFFITLYYECVRSLELYSPLPMDPTAAFTLINQYLTNELASIEFSKLQWAINSLVAHDMKKGQASGFQVAMNIDKGLFEAFVAMRLNEFRTRAKKILQSCFEPQKEAKVYPLFLFSNTFGNDGVKIYGLRHNGYTFDNLYELQTTAKERIEGAFRQKFQVSGEDTFCSYCLKNLDPINPTYYCLDLDRSTKVILPSATEANEIVTLQGDEGLATRRIYKKIVHKLSLIPTTGLAEAFCKAKCLWKFDWTLDQPHSVRNTLLQALLVNLKCERAVRRAISFDLINFFNASTTEYLREVEGSPIAQFYLGALNSALRAPRSPVVPDEILRRHGVVPESARELIAKPFVAAKMYELEHRAENLDTALAQVSKNPRVVPYFLLSDEESTVQVRIGNVYYDGKTFTAIVDDRTNSAEQKLEQLVGKISCTRINGLKVVEIPFEQFAILQKNALKAETLEYFILKEKTSPPSISPQSKPARTETTPCIPTQSVRPTFIPYKFPSNAWLRLMRQDLREVEKNIAQKLLKRRIVIDESFLQFREAKQLAAFPPFAKALSCFNALLKPYQREAVQLATNYRPYGIINALDMGLGKGMIGLEAIVQMMARFHSGHHLVFTPFGMLDSLEKEYRRGLCEAKLTALEVWSKRFPNESTIRLKRFVKELHCCIENNHKESILAYLRKLCGLPKEPLKEVLLPFKKETLCLIAKLVQEHFSWLKERYLAHPDKKRSCEEQLGGDLALPVDILPLANDPFSFLWLASELLKISPHRVQEVPEQFAAIATEGLIAIMDFPEHSLVATNDPALYKSTLERNARSILISNPETLKKIDFAIYRDQRILSLLIDEAHKLKKSTTPKNKRLSLLAKIVMENGKKLEIEPLLSCLTGTPLANDPRDLWNLLALVNPGDFAPETYNVIEKHLQAFVGMIKSSDKSHLQSAMNRSFIKYYVMKRSIVSRLVQSLKKQDRQVRDAWDNRFAEREDLPLDGTKHLTAATKTALKMAFTDFFESKDADEGRALLEYQHRLTRILIHPTLSAKDERLLLRPPNAKLNLYKDRIVQATRSEFSQVIAESALLGSLMDLSHLQAAISEQKATLVLFDSLAASRLMQETLLKKYPDCLEVKVYDGTLPREVKESVIDWFNQPKQSVAKILLLAVEAGGVGLNLPGAELVLNFSNGWVPAVLEQAINRAFRPNFLGKKQVVLFNFGTFLETIQKALKEVKIAWNLFFWPEEKREQLSLQEEYENFLHVVRKMARHVHVWENKLASAHLEFDRPLVEEKLDEVVEANLNFLKTSYNNEALQAIINRILELPQVANDQLVEEVLESGVVIF